MPFYPLKYPIMLYDYKRDTTLEIDRHQRYIALSYVWGTSGRVDEASQGLRGLQLKPRVIDYAARVAERLGV
jgi:hypothetical protein